MPNSSLPRPLALFLIVACEGEAGPFALPDPPADVSEWAVAGRHVAIFDKAAGEACPAATDTSWSGELLFRSGDALDLMKDATLPAPLERFCRYTWLGEAPPAAGPTFDPTWSDKLVRLDPDRDVLMPQTPYLGGDDATRSAAAS